MLTMGPPREEGEGNEAEGEGGAPGAPSAVFLFSFLLSFRFFCLFPFVSFLRLVPFFRATGEAGEKGSGALL